MTVGELIEKYEDRIDVPSDRSIGLRQGRAWIEEDLQLGQLKHRIRDGLMVFEAHALQEPSSMVQLTPETVADNDDADDESVDAEGDRDDATNDDTEMAG